METENKCTENKSYDYHERSTVNNLKFNVDNYDIQVVNEYRYLGIIFSKSSSFFKENIYKKNLQKQCMGVTIIY